MARGRGEQSTVADWLAEKTEAGEVPGYMVGNAPPWPWKMGRGGGSCKREPDYETITYC